jgi:hypothetical protein
MAVAQVLGAEAISDFQGLRHLRPVTGPVPKIDTGSPNGASPQPGGMPHEHQRTRSPAARRHQDGVTPIGAAQPSTIVIAGIVEQDPQLDLTP